MKKKADPLGQILHRFLKEYKMEDSFYLSYLQDHWADILNRQLANVSAPVKIEDQILTIKVKDQAWKKEFRERKELILEKIHRFTGSEFQLQEIRII